MNCRRSKIPALVLFFYLAIIGTISIAAVPGVINYQGRLTDASGEPVADETYQIKFKIYGSVSGADSLWTSGFQSIKVEGGLFTHLLGSTNPLPNGLFESDTIRYLGITVGTDAEISPRSRLVSSAYSYKAAYSDTADYARNAGGTGCDGCDETFVNVSGPDSVYSNVQAAFLGKSTGSRTSSLLGIEGYGSNSSSGNAYGGLFTSSSSGTGVHYGVSAEAGGSSSSASYGLDARAYNSSSGPAYGAALTAQSGGTGVHYGAYINSDGAATGGTFGVWSEAENTSTGTAFGGYFRTTTAGTGIHYGVCGNASGASTGDCYAIYGYGTNTSSGDVYGGYFLSGSAGTGVHYGVRCEGDGSTSSAAHGIDSRGSNTSTGSSYGGTFTATSSGTGTHYGVHSQSTGSSPQPAYAVYGTASNTSTGRAYGGYFSASNYSGTGQHIGVYGEAANDDATDCFGVYGYALNSSSGLATGGYFYAASWGTGLNNGIFAECDDGWAGWFQGHVNITGNLYVDGTKDAKVKIDNGEYRGVSCQESPEVWFEDFGESKLENGSVHIELDGIFLQTVTIDDSHPMQVFIQLYDENCKGTAVKRGTTGFDVIELQNGRSGAAFSYRIVAKRKGFEDLRFPVISGPTSEEMQRRSEATRAKFETDKAATQADRQQLISDEERSRPDPASLEEETR
jgi:hypothetical protein